ncbi:hypothetical protein MRX96_006062 [Rhipicephalus microplus]
MAAHAGPPGFDEEADNWEAYRLRLEAYFEVHDVTDEKKRRAILVTALSTKTGQLNISVTYGGTTLDTTLVVLGCSGPDLCGRDVIKALKQHGSQVLAVGMKAAPAGKRQRSCCWFLSLDASWITSCHVGHFLTQIRSTPEPLAKLETVWYRNYGTGARWKAGVVQTPEGHRMVTIKAADGEHHRLHYD